jgi:hypothetical protein
MSDDEEENYFRPLLVAEVNKRHLIRRNKHLLDIACEESLRVRIDLVGTVAPHIGVWHGRGGRYVYTTVERRVSLEDSTQVGWRLYNNRDIKGKGKIFADVVDDGVYVNWGRPLNVVRVERPDYEHRLEFPQRTVEQMSEADAVLPRASHVVRYSLHKVSFWLDDEYEDPVYEDDSDNDEAIYSTDEDDDAVEDTTGTRRRAAVEADRRIALDVPQPPVFVNLLSSDDDSVIDLVSNDDEAHDVQGDADHAADMNSQWHLDHLIDEWGNQPPQPAVEQPAVEQPMTDWLDNEEDAQSPAKRRRVPSAARAARQLRSTLKNTVVDRWRTIKPTSLFDSSAYPTSAAAQAQAGPRVLGPPARRNAAPPSQLPLPPAWGAEEESDSDSEEGDDDVAEATNGFVKLWRV